jgi:hypothetical protein
MDPTLRLQSFLNHLPFFLPHFLMVYNVIRHLPTAVSPTRRRALVYWRQKNAFFSHNTLVMAVWSMLSAYIPTHSSPQRFGDIRFSFLPFLDPSFDIDICRLTRTLAEV